MGNSSAKSSSNNKSQKRDSIFKKRKSNLEVKLPSANSSECDEKLENCRAKADENIECDPETKTVKMRPIEPIKIPPIFIPTEEKKIERPRMTFLETPQDTRIAVNKRSSQNIMMRFNSMIEDSERHKSEIQYDIKHIQRDLTVSLDKNFLGKFSKIILKKLL
jgi:hypothetical protein